MTVYVDVNNIGANNPIISGGKISIDVHMPPSSPLSCAFVLLAADLNVDVSDVDI